MNIPDRNIPQALDAERALLGGLIVDEDARLELLYKIKKDDFYINRHKLIFDAIKSLWNKNSNIDVIEISNELGNKLDECGGKSYLLELTENIFAILNPKQKFDIIREKARLRKLLSLGSMTMQMASLEESSDKIIAHIDKEVFELLEDQTSGERHVSDIADEALEMIEEIRKQGKPMAISTGHERLDQMMLGWENGKLYFLGGRSGVGKTGFAIDLIKKTSKNSLVCDFTLEMTDIEVYLRLLTNHSESFNNLNLNSHKLKNGNLTTHELEVIKNEITQELKKLNLIINDRPQTITKLKASIRKAKRKYGNIGLVVIDFFQLIEADFKYESREEKYAKMAYRLKDMTKELNVPILALSKINRRKDNEPPQTEDLSYAEAIVNACDVIMLAHRAGYKDSSKPIDHFELFFRKQRGGELGVVNFRYDLDTQSFHNWVSADWTDDYEKNRYD